MQQIWQFSLVAWFKSPVAPYFSAVYVAYETTVVWIGLALMHWAQQFLHIKRSAAFDLALTLRRGRNIRETSIFFGPSWLKSGDDIRI